LNKWVSPMSRISLGRGSESENNHCQQMLDICLRYRYFY
jgi:hypothetical protein